MRSEKTFLFSSLLILFSLIFTTKPLLADNRQNGMVIGAVVGAFGGALFGRAVGERIDEADRIAAENARQRAFQSPMNQPIPWQSREYGGRNGVSGEVVWLEEGRHRRFGGACRHYRSMVLINGAENVIEESVCQNQNGVWTKYDRSEIVYLSRNTQPSFYVNDYQMRSLMVALSNDGSDYRRLVTLEYFAARNLSREGKLLTVFQTSDILRTFYEDHERSRALLMLRGLTDLSSGPGETIISIFSTRYQREDAREILFGRREFEDRREYRREYRREHWRR